MITRSFIEECAAEEGLVFAASLPRDVVEQELSLEMERLKQWQERGFAGEMKYMLRPGISTLDSFLPGCRSLLVFLVPYSGEDPGPTPNGYGRVARYAWGLDYHEVLKEKLTRIAAQLGGAARVFSDAVPLLERAIARLGQLGFRGKNTLIIRPGVGSFSFIGEILTDQEIDPFGAERRGQGCRSCTRCLRSCPTEAIVAPFELNAAKCISYLTIEKRTAFSPWEREALGEWVFGCDLCQEVCPFNHGERSGLSEFGRENGVGPFLPLHEILSLRTDELFRRRFRNTALLRAKRAQMIRNAIAVAVNRKEVSLLPQMKEVSEEDPSPLAREAAHEGLRFLEQCA